MAQSFRFGVATADHQCEAYDGHDDIRDVWERVRGLVGRGKATDFWNRYTEDVELAAKMGCTAFRLSLSWARLEPEIGQWSEDAFAHYRSVLQCMRDAGMATVVTLVHNTWPLHVQAAGDGAGLLHEGFPERVARFAGETAKRLGDLIDYYVTLNEPNQLVYGYVKGFWMRSYAMPPGQPPYATGEEQMHDLLRLIPNLFRAHARARQAIHALHPQAKVGTNPLVLGLPEWLQNAIDRNATRLKSPQQVRRQAARLSQTNILEGGKVDISVAQITLTAAREDRALFSEPYFTAHLCVLHDPQQTFGGNMQTWQGKIGVMSDMLPATLVGGYFPAADIQYYATVQQAVDALNAKQVDAVFDDDAPLAQYVSSNRVLTKLRGHGQHFAVAMAFGSRSLLNAVDRALRDFKAAHPELPNVFTRKTIPRPGRDERTSPKAAKDATNVPDMDRSLHRIRSRGVLRVGIHPGVKGLCERDERGNYTGLEPDIARAIAKAILGDASKVQFVPLHGEQRMSATRSWLQVLFTLRKTVAIFGTLLGTNWWNLGMAGKLPEFLCPKECIGALDYVGLDYYWGVPAFWPSQLHRLSAAAEFRYASAPVWPSALETILRAQAKQFPGKPIIVIENGCVTSADGFTRAKYLEAHIREVQRARDRGVPVEAYLCWSITSNREWGLHFDDNSDFGLYHIDLDNDPELKRMPTESSEAYSRLIAQANSGGAK
ncbi:MAG TPA: family 1 glycosylhydrolase [Candidatus Baltobacteraceae bacterium]|jgi:beta-glucosidase/6-phospho-beta-glucosidase/beta-galactosidase/ABC-type amino acid transport substrate-binding protein|nr:family 1 glycosylhydrolase [Candidatus Baltobacteraceae bacterium]